MISRPRHLVLRGARGVAAALALWACVLSPQAWAEPDLGRVVSRLPMSVDFVAAVDDGAAMRQALHGTPIMLAASTLQRPGDVLAAWSGLAAAMDMTDAEAFDLLLGQRVILVGSNLQADAEPEPSWAILSELDPETEKRLRASLGAVPRNIVRGQPVLEFEHGSFLLATSSGRLRCSEEGGFQNTTASSILLLAPARDRALFEQLLPLLRCGTPTSSLADIPAGRMLADWPTQNAVFLWRLPDPLGSPHRFAAATVGGEAGRWHVQALTYPAGGWLRETDPDDLETWSPELLDTLPGDPALAIIGECRSVCEARSWVEPLMRSPVPDPQSEPLGRLLGRRSMMGVWFADDDELREPEILLATRTPDLNRLQIAADAYMAEQLNPPALGDERQSARVLLDPGASGLRSLAVAEEDGRTTPTSWSWVYVPEGEGEGDPFGEPAPGWWVMHYDPPGQQAAPTEEKAGAAPEAMPARRYLHAGRARPSVLADRAREEMPRLLSSVEGDARSRSLVSVLAFNEIVLAHLRTAEWAVWHDPLHDAFRADLTIEVHEAFGRPGDASPR